MIGLEMHTRGCWYSPAALNLFQLSLHFQNFLCATMLGYRLHIESCDVIALSYEGLLNTIYCISQSRCWSEFQQLNFNKQS